MADFRAGQILTATALNSIAAPGVEHIRTQNLASDGSFNNIPQTYRHLQIRLYGGIDGADTEIAMRLNGDNGNNYGWSRHAIREGGTGNNDGGLDNVSNIRVCFWGSVSSRQHCIINIHDYSGSHWQGALCSYGATGAGGQETGDVFGYYNVTGPITSIGFFVIGSGNAVSPQTICSIYGYV